VDKVRLYRDELLNLYCPRLGERAPVPTIQRGADSGVRPVVDTPPSRLVYRADKRGFRSPEETVSLPYEARIDGPAADGQAAGLGQIETARSAR
jgi:hypothetical protein